MGCFIDDASFNRPSRNCSGIVNPNSGNNIITFVVGNATRPDPSNGNRHSWVITNQDDWEINWNESCFIEGDNFCALSFSSTGYGRFLEVERTVTVTYLPTGQSRNYTMYSTVTFENIFN